MINVELIHFLLQGGLRDKKHSSRIADLAIIVETAVYYRRISSKEVWNILSGGQNND